MVTGNSKNLPLVSIIVPVYKVEKYLAEAVEPLLRQTYTNIEIILIDDGSPDNCGALCDNYALSDSRVKVVHQENRGLAAARNRGLQECQGDYIICVDSDDIVSEDYVELLLGMVIRWDADMAVCGVRDFLDGYICTLDEGSVEDSILLKIVDALEKFLYMDGFSTGVGGKICKRNLYNGISYPEGKLYEDIFTIYRLITKAEKVAYCPSAKYGYRIRQGSITQRNFSNRDMDCIEQAQLMYSDIIRFFSHLKNGAANRFLSATFNIFYKIPPRGYEKEMEECWKIIRKLRWKVLFGRKARTKARYAALLSLTGKKITYEIGSILLARINKL